MLDMSAVTGVTGFGDLTVTQVGSHVTIDAGGADKITLLNTLATDVDASDFAF